MSLDIKGSTITGDDARAEIVDKILTKQDLTTKELEFILSKLFKLTNICYIIILLLYVIICNIFYNFINFC